MSFSVKLLLRGLCVLAAFIAIAYLSPPLWSTYLWWNFPVADTEYLKNFQRKNGLGYECGRKNLAEREVAEDEVRACLRDGIHTNTVIYGAKRAGHEMAITSFSCIGSDFKSTVYYVTYGGSDTVGCDYTVAQLSAEIPPFKFGERDYYPADGLPNMAASVLINMLQSVFPKQYPIDVQIVE